MCDGLNIRLVLAAEYREELLHAERARSVSFVELKDRRNVSRLTAGVLERRDELAKRFEVRLESFAPAVDDEDNTIRVA